MPLLGGANVSAMPLVHPEEQVAPMPGGAAAAGTATSPHRTDDSFTGLRVVLEQKTDFSAASAPAWSAGAAPHGGLPHPPHRRDAR